jgi:hypothetical protein
LDCIFTEYSTSVCFKNWVKNIRVTEEEAKMFLGMERDLITKHEGLFGA